MIGVKLLMGAPRIHMIHELSLARHEYVHWRIQPEIVE